MATGNGLNIETNFDAEVFHTIASANTDENVIISPLLLESLLALVYLGSDGATAEELKQLLQLKRFASHAKMANYYAAHLDIATNDPDTQIQLSSKILLGENFEVSEEFQKIAQKYFQTATQRTDLQNAEQLQRDVQESMTKISADISENLVQQSATADALLLLGANFRSKWFLPFSAYRSGLYDFHVNATLQRMVPMLYDDDMFVKFGEFRELDARAIELPYEQQGDELAMLLVLPNKRDGLPELTLKLKALNLAHLAERMQMESVQVLLPKFIIQFECNLRPCLEKLAVSKIFSKDANFKHLLHENSQSALPISDLLHKVCIAVHESGSEVSSVAANKPIVISNSIDSKQKKFFRADHPFYFAIRNRDVTYFVGQVVKL